MKVLLYSEAINLIKISGLGRAIMHQQRALQMNGAEYTLDPRDDYDIVHINTLGPKSRHLAKKARKAGKRVVYHAHSTEEDFRNSFVFSNAISGLVKRWICSCYLCGDVIITPTEYSKGLLKGYGIKTPIFPISNGIELERYEPKPGDREAFRRRMDLSDSDKVVIAVGLYFERKGLLDFVQMAKDMPDYKFIWFGKTPLFSVPRKIRRAVRTKLPNLRFAGYVQPDELKQAYVGCDVFVFPTYEETEGIVLLEALAAEANVIIRDIPVFGWLTDGRDCYKAKDRADFERLICSVTAGRSASLRKNGRAAVQDMDLRLIGRKLISVYDGTAEHIAQA